VSSLPVLAHDLELAIGRAALRHNLAIGLVRAVVHVESGGNPWAFNPEPRYRYVWDVRRWAPFRTLRAEEAVSAVPPADFAALAGDPDQEWWGQRASWGLMQVMGAVARERGFRGPYLSELCDPAIGLDAGCRTLVELLRWARGDVTAAVAAYNGGPAGNAPGGPLRNQAYAGKVLALVDL
jgi:hypothetical protein